MLRRTFSTRLVAVLSATAFSACIPMFLLGANAPCPNMLCSPAVACGGQGGTFSPPGPMGLCSSADVGKACEYCDGTAAIRLCAPLGTGGRECTTPDAKTTCGNPQKGKCTASSLGGITYWWCKKTQGAGTVTCTNSAECNGDKLCPVPAQK